VSNFARPIRLESETTVSANVEDDMQYLLLIYNQERDWDRASDAQKEKTMQGHAALEAGLRKSGKYKYCGGLAGASAATCVRTNQGAFTVTDGPFAETREQVGGYDVVDAKDLNEAVEIAKRIPMLFDGMAVEIRHVMATPD
jgi:hypothetical protein